MDEIWSFIHKKERRVEPGEPAEWGDAYTYVALAPVTKLAIAGGGWLRVIDGGKTSPGLASAPGAPKLAAKPPVKPAPPRPMKQLDLFDLD